ncbi:hypothetical protein [Peribacillus alkalitolerans]|nr:hypothetical protein [Peribacillus alkalitolerans]
MVLSVLIIIGFLFILFSLGGVFILAITSAVNIKDSVRIDPLPKDENNH